jgi:fucose 4-O-acetylase-like acetyltransferase
LPDNEKPLESPPEPRARFYYIDWARTISVHFVIWFHCSSMASEVYDFQMKKGVRIMSDEDFAHHSSRVLGQMRVLAMYGIPAFFYISGFSTTFFNTEKKGFCEFFKARFMKLLLPFILGLIFLLTPRMYMS